jgi:hypothetical protein
MNAWTTITAMIGTEKASPPRDDQKTAKQDGAENTELRAEELKCFHRVQQRAAPLGVVSGMRECREAVGVIPNEIGNDEQQSEAKPGVQPVVLKDPPPLRRHDKQD